MTFEEKMKRLEKLKDVLTDLPKIDHRKELLKRLPHNDVVSMDYYMNCDFINRCKIPVYLIRSLIEKLLEWQKEVDIEADRIMKEIEDLFKE